MKKYVDKFEEGAVYVGEAWEIKAVYGSILRALDRADRNHQDFHMFPGTLSKPTFREGRLYALCIEGNGDMWINNSDTIARMFVEGSVVEA